MTAERAKEFQTQITKEIITLRVIHSEASGEEAVTLIGKAWSFPVEVTTENLGLIQQERDVLRRISAGENARKQGWPLGPPRCSATICRCVPLCAALPRRVASLPL